MTPASGDLTLSSSTPRHATEKFYTYELRRALSEQAFGITSASIVSSSSTDATAVIALLEGVTVCVVLTIQGYKVHTLRFAVA
jgi:hypothetical protein